MAIDKIAGILEHIDPQISTILHRALEDEEISWQDGLRLCETNGIDFHAVCLVADEMRKRQVGDAAATVAEPFGPTLRVRPIVLDIEEERGEAEQGVGCQPHHH